MTKLLRGSLVTLGAVVAALGVQQWVTIDRSTATESARMATRPADRPLVDPTHPGYQVARALGRAAPTTPSETHHAAATPEGEPDADASTADAPSGWLAWLGLSESGPETRGKGGEQGSGVRVINVPGTATKKSDSTSSGTTPQECRGDLDVHPQGVTAAVSFVGITRAGREIQARQFAGADLADLKILVQWQHLFSNHGQRVELIAPDGSSYQSLSRPLTASDVNAPVITFLPVSGTWITRYGLYGAWCVDVFFDSDEKPIASTRLVLAPPS